MNHQTTPTTASASPEFQSRVHLGQPWGSQWRRFEADMGTLGLRIHECAGPLGWGGPAVTVPLTMLDKIKVSTKVEVEHHAEGDRVMVYPAPVWV